MKNFLDRRPRTAEGKTFQEWLASAKWRPPGFASWYNTWDHWSMLASVEEAISAFTSHCDLKELKLWLNRYERLGVRIEIFKRPNGTETDTFIVRGYWPNGRFENYLSRDLLECFAKLTSENWHLIDAQMTEDAWLGIARL